MFRIQNISIRNKLVLMQVFTSVIVLGLFFAVFITTDLKEYKKRKEESVSSLAHIIGANSISSLQFQDNDAATGNLADLRKIAPDISNAIITDKTGNIFASYSKLPTTRTDSFLLNTKATTFSGKQFFSVTDIINDREFLGKVMLEVELTEFQQIKKQRFALATLLLLASLGFSFLLAILVQQYLSKRLLHLVNRMKEVGKTGDYTPVKDEGKDEIGLLVQAYNKLMNEVKENQHKKDEFIGIASHELKTPLTSIKGYLDLLNMMEDGQPHKLYVRKSLDSAHKLERLIQDLLDVSKIQSGQLQLNIQQFNIEEMITETISAFQMVSPTHTIVKESTLNGQLAFADKQRIEQVLINLLSNAIKYSPGENKVIVYATQQHGEFLIKVRDYGLGIPEEEKTEIFERFYRTKDASVHISGFGLGLYICRDIINRHNGKIWVEREDKGSSFYFSLPLHPKGNAVATGQ